MKMFIKLFILSVLFSYCLAVTLPKSSLLKLCKTAISVRNLGLNDNEIVLAMNYIGNNYIRQLEPLSHFKQMIDPDCALQFEMTNSGGLQIMLVPVMGMGSGMNANLLKALQSRNFALERTSNFSSVADSNLVSSFISHYCENIDFPESIDIENQVEVQKAVFRIISSLLKQHINATQSIEDYLNTVDKQLFN